MIRRGRQMRATSTSAIRPAKTPAARFEAENSSHAHRPVQMPHPSATRPRIWRTHKDAIRPSAMREPAILRHQPGGGDIVTQSRQPLALVSNHIPTIPAIRWTISSFRSTHARRPSSRRRQNKKYRVAATMLERSMPPAIARSVSRQQRNDVIRVAECSAI